MLVVWMGELVGYMCVCVCWVCVQGAGAGGGGGGWGVAYWRCG